MGVAAYRSMGVAAYRSMGVAAYRSMGVGAYRSMGVAALRTLGEHEAPVAIAAVDEAIAAHLQPDPRVTGDAVLLAVAGDTAAGDLKDLGRGDRFHRPLLAQPAPRRKHRACRPAGTSLDRAT